MRSLLSTALMLVIVAGIFTLGAVAAAGIPVERLPEGTSAFRDQVYLFMRDWQTLIAGLVAIAAAWWTYETARSLQDRAELMERDRIRRERVAARLYLPSALSAICDYATHCATALSVPPPVPVEVPDFPMWVLERLHGCLLYEDGPEAKNIIRLANWIQVHEARLRGARAREDLGRERYRFEQFQDVATLYKYSEDLFDYARQEEGDEQAQNRAENVRRMIRLTGLHGAERGWMGEFLNDQPEEGEH